MNGTPEISVIMSVYNGEKYLSEAVDSICGQTFQDWELIVINDCSADSTAQILEKYAASDNRIRVYTNEYNLKLPASLNKAIGLARGRYIARMDADDIALPERLEKQLEFMKAHSDVMISSCRYMTLSGTEASSGGGGGRCDFEAVKALLLVTNPILHPGVIAKSDVIKKLGYDETLTCTEDFDIWARAAKSGMAIKIQRDYLMLYRIHGSQITGTTLEKQKKEVLSIQKRHYPEIFGVLSRDMLEFYVSGIYFREKINTGLLCVFRRTIKEINKKVGYFKNEAIDYAFLEILAEYKRCGAPKSDVLKCLMTFNPVFLIKEFTRRKITARKDGKNCISSAEKNSMKYTGNSTEFPSFTILKG